MRLLIFTDLNSAVTKRLIGATLGLATERQSVEIVGVVITQPRRLELRGTRAKRLARLTLVATSNRHMSLRDAFARSVGIMELLRRHDVPILTPPEGDPNEPAFRRRVTEELGADVALSYYCLRVFRRPLLDSFRHAVNFHNGLLPQYKGLMATSFALYHGEPRVGYTFHRMTEELDGGPILKQNAVDVEPHDGLGSVTTRLAEQAGRDVPLVLDMIAADEPGRPQTGPSSYFSRRDILALTQVGDPQSLTAGELQRRLRAFGTLDVTIGGTSYPVTRLRSTSRAGSLAFRTLDGSLLVPDRLSELPASLRHLRRVRGRPIVRSPRSS